MMRDAEPVAAPVISRRTTDDRDDLFTCQASPNNLESRFARTSIAVKSDAYAN